MSTEHAGTSSTTSTNATTSAIEVKTQTPAMAAYAAARQDLITKISTSRLEHLAAVLEADSFKVEDDYKNGLMVILAKYPEGVSLAHLQSVFGDADKLRKAKKELGKADKIKEDKPDDKRNSKVLVLVK